MPEDKRDVEIAMLKGKVMALEQTVKALSIQTTIFNPTSMNLTPAGYLEIMVGGDTVRLPYFPLN